MLVFGVLLAVLVGCFVVKVLLRAYLKLSQQRYARELGRIEAERRRSEARSRARQAKHKAVQERFAHFRSLQETLYQRLLEGDPSPDEEADIAKKLAELKELMPGCCNEIDSMGGRPELRAECNEMLARFDDRFGEVLRS